MQQTFLCYGIHKSCIKAYCVQNVALKKNPCKHPNDLNRQVNRGNIWIGVISLKLEMLK